MSKKNCWCGNATDVCCPLFPNVSPDVYDHARRLDTEPRYDALDVSFRSDGEPLRNIFGIQELIDKTTTQQRPNHCLVLVFTFPNANATNKRHTQAAAPTMIHQNACPASRQGGSKKPDPPTAEEERGWLNATINLPRPPKPCSWFQSETGRRFLRGKHQHQHQY